MSSDDIHLLAFSNLALSYNRGRVQYNNKEELIVFASLRAHNTRMSNEESSMKDALSQSRWTVAWAEDIEGTRLNVEQRSYESAS